VNTKIISRLTCIADSLPYQHRVRILAALVDKNKIWSVSSNKTVSDPFHLKFNDYPFPHAEVSAIKQFIKVYDIEYLQRCTLYVIRRKYHFNDNNKTTIYGDSRPCDNCMKAISYYKIPKLVYVNDRQVFIEERRFY
jgi:tRNA(Arg) A34 adenosine deaminase TadA